MDDLLVKIIYCAIIFVFAFLTSLALQLNKFAKDKDKNCAKYGLVYISDAIVSAISGFLLGLLTLALLPDNHIVWIVAGILGGFLGQKLIPMILKIFLTFFKSTLSSEELQKLVKDLDTSSEPKKPPDEKKEE